MPQGDIKDVQNKPRDNYPEEKTEVIYGIEDITRRTLERLYSTRVNVDSCIDPLNPSTIMNAKPIVDAMINLQKRGIMTRVITELTKDNLNSCKELIKVNSEVRHLDEIKGNFSISDRQIYQATTIGNFFIPSKISPSMLSSELEHNSQEARQLTQSIFSTVRAFVEQQQYFFEMLWRKAIPAKQRIKEIEEGLKREFIETIQDPAEIHSLVLKVISSATEEIDIVFSTPNSFKRYQKEGIIDMLTIRTNEDNLRVRILVNHNYEIQETLGIFTKRNPQITIRNLEKSVQTKVNTIVADNELSLVIELKDDSKQDSNKAMGLATYSNSESTVTSYASIFEILWTSARPHSFNDNTNP
jgi:two-component system, OmpR family, sensor histidine kinase VicK